MQRKQRFGLIVSVAGLWLCAAVEGRSPGTRETIRVDASGVWTETVSGDGAGGVSTGGPRGTGIIWQLHDDDSVVWRVAIADTLDESWVAHDLNVERLSFLATTGTGVPVYEFDLVPEDPGTVAVGSAEDASLGLLLVAGPGGASIRGFSAAGGATPIWTYSFDANYTSTSHRNVDASLDGSIVIGAASDQNAGNSIVVILDGTNGTELSRLENLPFVGGVELSDDGGRAMITHVSNGHGLVIETSGMTTLATFAGSGAGSVYHRLSGDGTVAAVGGFSSQVYKETGGVWSQIWSESETSQWYGRGLALSQDGGTLFSTSFDFTNVLDLTYRVIDLVGGVELARTTTSGTGLLQDPMVDADASADGQVFAVVSWGTEDNVHPEVQMFDRDLNLIGSIDTPGSPFDVDVTRDGRFVLVGGKTIHANDTGRGSDTYAYELPTTIIPTVSAWGMVAMALLVLTGGILVCARRRATHAS